MRPKNLGPMMKNTETYVEYFNAGKTVQVVIIMEAWGFNFIYGVQDQDVPHSKWCLGMQRFKS